jgi:hypothetical protein
VDRIYTEKQCRLLTEPLYSSWPGLGEGRTFLALANVGWFHTVGQPPLVPDVLFSLDVVPAGDLHTKAGHSYFQWLIGKPPEVLFEIVSDPRGGEEHLKMQTYARLGVSVYVIYDPDNILKGGKLRVYFLQQTKYEPTDQRWFPQLGLGLTLWEGTFENQRDTWLRWCDRDGVVIPTGAERAEMADRRATEAAEKIGRLEAQLRALGVDPGQ